MAKSTQKYNRTTKIANWSDVQRIYYSMHVTAFLHPWAYPVLSLLTPAALTVLQFFAALNRSDKGYAGTAVAYCLLSQQIYAATGRKCGVRTLQRGVADLKKMGLMKATWWASPDQSVVNGLHNHKIEGTKRVQTEDGWKTRQIRVLVLTEYATGLWDKATSKDSSHIMRHFGPLLSTAKKPARSQIELIDKSIKIEQAPVRIDNVTNSIEIPEERGKSTSPKNSDSTPTYGRVKSESSAVGQSALKANTAQSDSPQILTVSMPIPNSTSFRGMEAIGSVISNSILFENRSEVEKTKSAKLVPKIQNTEKKQPEKSKIPEFSFKIPPKKPKPKSKKPKPRGISEIPPKIPKNAKNKSSFPVARDYLLSELAKALKNFSTYEADQIYKWAKYELSGDYPSYLPTKVGWSYWLGKYGYMLPQQRRYHMFRDILPSLRSKFIPIPMPEPRRYKFEPKAKKIENSKLPDFLARCQEKFCK